ncbi:MAG: hypothetical protein ACOYVK_17900 [Bacillota bacterium]
MRTRHNGDFLTMLLHSAENDEEMKNLNEFLTIYANKPDRQLLREIMIYNNQLPENERKQHIKNLDLLSQMEGIVTDDTKQRLDIVNRVLRYQGSIPNRVPADVEQQLLFGGIGFFPALLLLYIFRRRPVFRRPIY